MRNFLDNRKHDNIGIMGRALRRKRDTLLEDTIAENFITQ